MKADIAGGLLISIRGAITGEVLSDLLKLCRTVLEAQGDSPKNVAAVLAAAAFEDTVRRMAERNGLDAEEKLSDVLSALKGAGIIQGAQVGIAQSYLGFRNRALHANWNEIDRPEVVSVLGFVEQLILKHFG
jgi:2-hydroxychromene-2-carboxylate isomerase